MNSMGNTTHNYFFTRDTKILLEVIFFLHDISISVSNFLNIQKCGPREDDDW